MYNCSRHTITPFSMRFLIFSKNIVTLKFLDANNVQCIQTCKNLGCLSGIYFPQSMTVNWPKHPVGCTCVVCNNNGIFALIFVDRISFSSL